MHSNTFATFLARLWGMDKRQTLIFLAFVAGLILWNVCTFVLKFSFPVSMLCAVPMFLVLLYGIHIAPKKTPEENEGNHE